MKTVEFHRLLSMATILAMLAPTLAVQSALGAQPRQTPYSKTTPSDYRVSVAQNSPPASSPSEGVAGRPANPSPNANGASLDLPSALELTLNHNPTLVAQRQELGVSAEAIEVARRFPTSLNPSVSVDVAPWIFERAANGEIDRLHTFVTFAWAQPIELGNRTALRESIARATYNQTRWNVLQAELLALVQTYRGFQTATYRREKLGVAERLVEFNRHLVEVLRRRTEAGQAAPADLVVAEVESQATAQLAALARQEYAVALAESLGPALSMHGADTRTRSQSVNNTTQVISIP